MWAGKQDAGFRVDTVSLHVHERIDPATIIERALKKEQAVQQSLFHYFERPENVLPLRRAIEFYRHEHNWSNRLIAGDSLLVMNSLLKKESMAGKVSMIYVDPPYGIKYGSNFQAFVNKKDVKDGRASDLTREPETVKAFRDTWEWGIHSYLTYLRKRLVLARELLSEAGSVFVQIGDENMHVVRAVMDEIFGKDNSFAAIVFKKKNFTNPGHAVNDYILHYAKDKSKAKAKDRPLYGSVTDTLQRPHDKMFGRILTPRGDFVKPKDEDEERRLISRGGRWCRSDNRVISQHHSETRSGPITLRGRELSPGPNSHWAFDPVVAIPRLEKAGRLHLPASGRLSAFVFWSDVPRGRVTNLWDDTAGERDPVYVVQTSTKVVERCMVMCTDPGDLVLDLTCGSGTTAYVAEQWGRRWITCDTSRIAIALAKQRLVTAFYPYYLLQDPNMGVRGGFKLKTTPYITLASIAENPGVDRIWGKYQEKIRNLISKVARLTKTEISGEWDMPGEAKAGWPSGAAPLLEEFWTLRESRQKEIDRAVERGAESRPLYDRPEKDEHTMRVSGPFTIEAVPAPSVKSLDAVFAGEGERSDPDAEYQRQEEWRRELLNSGIRGKDGQKIEFGLVEPHPSTKWLHAQAETKERRFRRAMVSFGPPYAPLGPAHVSRAIEEARTLIPKPDAVIFAALHFDPEAEKDIGELRWPGIAILKAHMNTDVLTRELRGGNPDSESFWLMGEPDVTIKKKGTKHTVTVRGFDYYNATTKGIESGDSSRISMWMLDTDYDGRSIYPRQIFFPMRDGKGWEKLAKTLGTDIDDTVMEKYRGTESVPFEPGSNRRIAVKIIDDRGIESLRVMDIEA